MRSSAHAAVVLAYVLLFSACTQRLQDPDLVTSVTFNGWDLIKATGAKTPSPQASDLASASAAVTLTWPAITVTGGDVSYYNVYRSSSSADTSTTTPYFSGVSPTSLSFTDTNVVSGQTYYYRVYPVVSGSLRIPTASADSAVKVMVPPDNMVLLHRWSANKEACELLGRTPDRSNNYRCSVATGGNAPPGTGGSGYIDLGASMFVDAYEQGCNYSFDPVGLKCGSANGCIGTLASPNAAVNGALNDVYYSRSTGRCFINTNGATAWTLASAGVAAQRKLMGSAAPGLPPFVNLDQLKSQDVCTGQTVSGVAGTKRLLKRREFFLAAAWSGSTPDATINTIENGTNLDTTRNCNTNYASPQGNTTTDVSGTNPTIAYDNLASPAAKETIPGCLNNDCAAGVAARIRSLRTGSALTANCISRYGAQDMVGNVQEWTSDQASCTGVVPYSCTGVAAAANTCDTSNDDFSGLLFDNVQGPISAAPGVFSTTGMVQLPVGIPIVGAAFTGDGVATRSSASFHTDYYFVTQTPAGVRAPHNGGAWSTGANAGRFAFYLVYVTTNSGTTVGFRCGITAE